MEASVATPEAPPEVEEVHDGHAEATRSTEELFQWSGYVHVGRGAEECEHGADGECKEPEHFHAWVCLPNTFQIRDIGDKARAAKARKIRALKDPDSDAHVTLEAELDQYRAPARLAELINALSQARVESYLADIVKEVSEDERFEHYKQDQEEFRRLGELPEDERDQEEFDRLQADILAYAEAVEAAVNARAEREAEALRNVPVDEVIAEQRGHRVEHLGNEAYMNAYYTWVMFVGTREPSTSGFPSCRKFAKPEDFKDAAPEAVIALRAKVQQLESRTTSRGDAAGN